MGHNFVLHRLECLLSQRYCVLAFNSVHVDKWWCNNLNKAFDDQAL